MDVASIRLALAWEHQKYHADVFGCILPNIEFDKAHIERLGELVLRESSFFD